MCLNWLQKCGHKTISVIGGATALIGDPSGKTESRKMLTQTEIEINTDAIEMQMRQIFATSGDLFFNQFSNNMHWTGEATWLDLLRTIGPHFSVAHMLSMDSVKSRLSDGLTALEFNYMLMQAYDFFILNNLYGCSVQIGGQDQWGNIIMGIDLIRKKNSTQVYGLTFPLLTQSNGKKFGKTEKGNIWLDEALTSNFEFFQFWRNVPDADITKLLRFLTMRPIKEIDEIVADDINHAKEILAVDVTGMVRGHDVAADVLNDVRKAFHISVDASGDHIPNKIFPLNDFVEGIKLSFVLKDIGFCKSNTDAGNYIKGNAITVNDIKINDSKYKLVEKDILSGSITIRLGKKKLFRIDVR
jgi:tyrosyl-tRNA synthetase